MTENEAFSAQTSNFSIKNVLSRSFFVFRKSPFFVIGLSFLILTLGSAIMFLTDFSHMRRPLVRLLVLFICTVSIHGMVVHCVYEVLCNRSLQFGKSISIGMACIGSLVLAALSIFAFVVIVLLALFAYLKWLGPFKSRIIIPFMKRLVDPYGLTLIILVTLAIPALALRLSIFVPACVTERLGAMESLMRSHALTKRFLLQMIGIYLLCFFVVLPFVFMLPLFSHLRGDIIRTFITNLGSTAGRVCFSVFFSILAAIPTAFGSILTSVTYYSFREVEGGVPVDQLWNAFERSNFKIYA